MSSRAFRLPWLLAGSLPLLASCSLFDTPAEKFAPACPRTAILSDAADLSRFHGAGHDITDMVISGRIVGLSGNCKLDDPGHLRTTISVSLELTRGPAAPGRTVDVQYFVAVSEGDRIMAKQDYTSSVSFARNTDRVRLTGDELELVLPVSKAKSGAAYSVLVGFQLSPDELAFNRARSGQTLAR